MTIAVTTGIASGIDYEEIISATLDVEQVKIDAVTEKQEAYETEISAYGVVKSSLATFQDAIEALSEDLYSYSATSSDEDILTVEITDTVVSGTYQLTVSQIAKQEILTGGSTFTSEDAEVGTGILSITVGDGTAVEVEIGEDQNTLEGIVEAINSADAGVTASIMQVSDGSYALALTADDNGESITFSISSDGDSATTDAAGLSALYADASTGAMTTAQEGTNAVFSLGGQSFERSTNEIDDLVAGLTINLEGSATGTTVTIQVETDTSGISDKIQTAVDAYNSLVDTLAAYQDDSDEDTIGVLFGDTTINRLKSKLANSLFEEVDTGDSSISYLSNLGVELGDDGYLYFTEDTLSTALEDNESAVIDFFTDEESGFAVSMGDLLATYLDTDGVFDTKTETLQTSVDELDDKISTMEDDLAEYEEELQAKYAALETLLADLESESDSLTSLLDSLISSDS